MNWAPIQEVKLWDKINMAYCRMNPPQERLWNTIKIIPEKWQQHPYGDVGNGFWVVAIIGTTVVWYNDIEEGFNCSPYRVYGEIDKYYCNQDELEWAIQSILNMIEYGHAPVSASAPIAGEFKSNQ